jgi:hypothetical protein
MNERINELLKQSRTEYWTQYTPSYDYEKFAQLIVRECVVMTKGYEYALGRKDELSKAMSEHFGVEE